jgi:hypothetical protein
VVVRADGNRIHVAIQALALENARLRAELACYRALEACGAERVHRTLVGAGGAALHGKGEPNCGDRSLAGVMPALTKAS